VDEAFVRVSCGGVAAPTVALGNGYGDAADAVALVHDAPGIHGVLRGPILPGVHLLADEYAARAVLPDVVTSALFHDNGGVGRDDLWLGAEPASFVYLFTSY
jgi:hypothetical protein